MQTARILKRLLNVKFTVIQNMEIRKINGEECLVIQARPVKRKEHRCGICGRKCSCYDKGYEH